MKLVDKNNIEIDYMNVEQHEWQLAQQYVKPSDCVLELGARYGTVSVVVNKILTNKDKMVCVEPDKSVWRSLEKNREQNNCSFIILKGAISKKSQKFYDCEYGSFTLNDEMGETSNFDLIKLQNTFGLQFNVLIADCEGCVCTLFNDYPEFVNQLTTIIFEADGLNATKCNPQIVIEFLLHNGFKHEVVGLHNVFLK